MCVEVRDWVLSAITLYLLPRDKVFSLNPGLLFSLSQKTCKIVTHGHVVRQSLMISSEVSNE